MNLLIACIGRLKGEAEREIVQRYIDRLNQIGRGVGLATPSILEFAESKARTVAERKTAEAALLKNKIPADTQLVALDERGKMLTSEAFAACIGRYRDDGARSMTFLIGGPDGLAPEMVDEAGLCLAFGRMTMPHGLLRGVLMEQLYRAATILAGHPYHRV